ncbi:MAG TPA: dephospho-CoA kinase [Acidimicrobiaceae bacterium]|nr:dephospho-CoA kinase [Acidimicrobiaceae bacterium]
MIVVALTGGIGSGKTTVSAGLVERGAALIDADVIVRELQQPGGEVLAAMAERFGAGVLSADGSLDRQAVAAIVFGGKGEPAGEPEGAAGALADLNAIVHPPVGREIRARLDAEAALPDSDRNLVVLDIPLLAEGLLAGGPPRYPVSGILVVDAPSAVAEERLVGLRGLSRDDARARIASQATREQRLALADHVTVNSGSPAELRPRIDAAHAWAVQLPAADYRPAATA